MAYCAVGTDRQYWSCVIMGKRDTSASMEVGDLRSLADRCVGDRAPAKREVEEALEGGFGRLIALEATLQRVQRSPFESVAEFEGQIDSLRGQIEMLREALAELRRRFPADRPSQLARGFVLPVTP